MTKSLDSTKILILRNKLDKLFLEILSLEDEIVKANNEDTYLIDLLTDLTEQLDLTIENMRIVEKRKGLI